MKIWSPESTDCSVTPAETELTRPSASGFAADGPAGGSSNGGPRPTVKLLFSSSDDGTVKVWDLIVSSRFRVNLLCEEY